jgi:drug/metabolite transporter (DMT)-like permease
MFSLPVLLGLTTAFCWGSSDFLSRYQSERVGYYNTVVYALLTNLVVLILLYPALRPPMAAPLVPVLLMVGAGFLNFFAFIFLYRAFHTGVVSVVAPVAYTYPVVTSVLSIILLGSVLVLSEAVAIAAVILGVILLSTRFSELRTSVGGGGLPRVVAGVEWAVCSSLSFGVLYVVVGYATPFLYYFLPVVIIRGVGAVLGFVAAPAFKARVRPTRASFSLIILTMAVLEAVGLLTFNYGLFVGPNAIPVVAALSGMGGAVAASYALLLLKERLEKNQVMGAILAIAGVSILLFLVG